MDNSRKIYARLAGLWLASCVFLCLQAQVNFQLIDSPQLQYALRVQSSALTQEEGKNQLQVFVDQPERTNTPPMLGSYEQKNQYLTFKPLISFKPHLRYLAVFQQKDTFSFKIPARKDQVVPQLVGIYPSTDSIPENLLKIYLYFNQPMAEGQAYSKVFIEKKDGSRVEKPFLELQPELWNEDQTRLTLWLDPGRVKRELGPNQAMGPPLIAHQEYQLTIDPSWESQQGVPLGKLAHKNFFTYSADRLSPDPDHWSIKPPKAGSQSPLQIRFHEPLDHALLQHCIEVLDEEKNVLTGAVKTSEQERHWSFVPALPWKAGRYQLRIDARLEDLAANNLNRPFDRDMTTTQSRDQTYYWMSFEIIGIH